MSAQESGYFLKLPMSVRGAAMGDAFTALANEPLGIYYNPAGIALMKRPAVSLAHHVYLQEISGETAGFAMEFGKFSVGLAPTVFKMTEEKVYDSFGNDTGETFGYESMIVPVALAGYFGPVAVGAAAKAYSEELGGESSKTTAFDIGAIYKFNSLLFGISAQNLSGTIFDYPLAKIQRFGAAYVGSRFRVAADAVKEGSAGNYFNVGGEYSLIEMIRLRAGMRLREEFGGPTFGLGVNLGNFAIDYAFVGYGDLGDTHKAGITYMFGEKEQAEEAAPAPLEANTANSIPELKWTGEENYAAGGISTGTGNNATAFVYRVKYADADGNAPARGYPKVHITKDGSEISGSPFTMEFISGDNRAGAVFSYSKMLPVGNAYAYFFEARDTAGALASGPPAKPSFAPVVSKLEEVKMFGGTNVAVADFIGKNVSQADASIVGDFLRTELVNTGQFNVMDRNNMDTVLAEQKFQTSGCTEQQCAVEMGKLLNVKRMLVGSLSKLLDSYFITVNVVDVETGKIIASYDAEASSSKELRNACRKLVEKLSKK
ncbi:MAG: hypothetical protein A3J79_01195 [Elusimicrobia bacterium RIFOXYB2_FULL_62_6]|nr:MAG: hypothetical protein A3J79_01195 [Elusimicrobia bacterium RIFOXYB2_FULL_62_6]